MVTPKTTTWKLEPHTRAKHAILERYLKAWLPILSRGGFPEILYIDGFAGPGEYSDGEKGSPVIVLDIAKNYNPPLMARIHFLFIERYVKRANHLKYLVDTITLPGNFTVIIEVGTTFEEAFNRQYFNFRRSDGQLLPTFAFIDPFGWKGVPFSVVKEIMRHRSCEVFVNFMYEEVNRFLSHPEQVRNFDQFFGTNAWRTIVSIQDPKKRNQELHDLYAYQLRFDASARYVRSFEMKNERDVTDYFLFYATNSKKGLRKMKEAMWKVDESGEFSFSDATNQDQFILFEKSPNFGKLRQQILERYDQQQTTFQSVEDFVVCETAFRETHIKRVLRELEKEGFLTVTSSLPNRRRGTFKDPDMILQFKSEG